ncbi:MAG: hypothetical protein N2504_02250 [candidate division WOR-3 bacterium]|nr:hypothetical protein [candidate division WOR-3 bacterium]
MFGFLKFLPKLILSIAPLITQLMNEQMKHKEVENLIVQQREIYDQLNTKLDNIFLRLRLILIVQIIIIILLLFVIFGK